MHTLTHSHTLGHRQINRLTQTNHIDREIDTQKQRQKYRETHTERNTDDAQTLKHSVSNYPESQRQTTKAPAGDISTHPSKIR